MNGILLVTFNPYDLETSETVSLRTMIEQLGGLSVVPMRIAGVAKMHWFAWVPEAGKTPTEDTVAMALNPDAAIRKLYDLKEGR